MNRLKLSVITTTLLAAIAMAGCQGRSPEFVKPGWTVDSMQPAVMVLMPPRPGKDVPETAQYEIRALLHEQAGQMLPLETLVYDQIPSTLQASELTGLAAQAAAGQTPDFAAALQKAGAELGAQYFLFTEIVEWKERPFRHAGSAEYDPYWEPWYHHSPARHHRPWVHSYKEYEGIDYFVALNVKIWDAQSGELLYDNYERCTHSNYRGSGALSIPAKECVRLVVKHIPGAGAKRR